MKYFAFLFLFCYPYFMEARLGWDGIQAVPVEGFECLGYNNFSFYIGRIWRSKGLVDMGGIQNIKNAREAGWKYVDGYFFPCLRNYCPSAKEQMETALNRTAAEKAQIGMLWLDIQKLEWPTDKNLNRAFIIELVKQAEAMNAKIGIYTKKGDWKAIVGLDWDGVADKPLWYANWNGRQDFDGFISFGGWKMPAMQQFNGDVEGPCGIKMDKDWYP